MLALQGEIIVKIMKFDIRPILVLTLALIVGACGTPINLNPANIVKGSGTLKSVTRPVSGFSAVTLANSGDVTITVADTESLTIETDDNILPFLTTDVSGGRLTLDAKPNTSVQPTKGIKYTLTVKNLSDVQVSGSGNLTASSIDADKFGATLSGSGNITLNGKTADLNVQLPGGGTVNGENLDSKTATANVSGSGSILLKVSDNLNATVSGSGSITYIGDPVVSKTISGSGDVTKR